METSTDYGARCATGGAEDSVEELRARHAATGAASFDIDETELAEGYDHFGAELVDDELIVPVIPMRADEFRCDRCFLVCHNSQRHGPDRNLCRECA